MERRQARTMRIYSERKWKKVFLTVSTSQVDVFRCAENYIEKPTGV